VTHDQGEALALSDRLGVMAAGRLEQVGTPMEIYERPVTRFVASFIGDANLLDGVVERVEASVVVVRAGDLRLHARRLGPEVSGEAVTLCVRPERVRVDATLDLPTVVALRVEDRAFSGSLVKYRLAAPALRLHAAVPYLNGSRLFDVGDEVAAGWDPPQAVILPR
jgi:ABC-type Fe3+/spermidine/putrescine transport system ATPase subunit